MKIIIIVPHGAGDGPTLPPDLTAALRDSGHEVEVAEKLGGGRDALTSAINFLGRYELLIAFVDAAEPDLYLTIGLALGTGKQVLIVHPPEVKLPPLLDKVDKLVRDASDERLVFRLLEHVGKCSFDLRSWLREYVSNPSFFDSIDEETFRQVVFNGFVERNYEPLVNDDPSERGYDILLKGYHGFGKTVVQLKKYNLHDKVSIGEVQQLLGAVYASGAECGIMLTSSHFTRSAKEFAAKLKGKIELWGVDKLVELTKHVIHEGIEVGVQDLEQLVHAHQNSVMRRIELIIEDAFQRAAAGGYNPDALFRRVLYQIELSRASYKGFVGRKSGKDICDFLREEFTEADLQRIYERLLIYLPKSGEDPEAKYNELKRRIDRTAEMVFNSIYEKLRALES